MCLKKSIGREVVRHPTRVTSDMIRRELRDLELLGPANMVGPATFEQHLQQDAALGLGDLYEQHPVTLQAFGDGFRREHVVPLSVYFDGVQYTKNENFLGFYVTNLRTGVQRLVWLLRTWEALRPNIRPQNLS